MTLQKKLHAQDLFDSLQPEEEQKEDRKIEVKGKSEIRDLLVCYFSFLQEYVEREKIPDSLIGFVSGMHHLKDYPFDRKFAPPNFSAKDLEDFCKKMLHYTKPYEAQFESLDSLIGCYLSFLVETCSDDAITLDLINFPELCNIGYNNRKNVLVKGDVGYGFGTGMNKGLLKIEGNINGGMGDFMNGGRIEVNGNISGDICEDMKGGEVYIRGNLTEDWGGDGSFNVMTGGKVTLDGDFKGLIGNIQGGKVYLNGNFKGKFTKHMEENEEKFPGADIYHKRVKIVKDGRKVKQ